MIRIQEFEPIFQDDAVNHILDIENNEFSMGLTIDMQPDIADIRKMYQLQKGNFWLAFHDGHLMGTIGIYHLNEASVELRRMFVCPEFRGKEWGIGQKLLDMAIGWSIATGYQEVYLETTDWLVAASRFYLKNNFTYVDIDQLPLTLPVLRATGKFMRLHLR